MTLRIRLFGSLELERDGRPLPRFASRKSGELFAYLALNRKAPHTREHLCRKCLRYDPTGKRQLSAAIREAFHECAQRRANLLRRIFLQVMPYRIARTMMPAVKICGRTTGGGREPSEPGAG